MQHRAKRLELCKPPSYLVTLKSTGLQPGASPRWTSAPADYRLHSREQMSPDIRRTPSAQDALSSLAGVHIPLRKPQSRLWRRTPRPGGCTQGSSSRGLALCPQGATWTRVSLTCSLSRPEEKEPRSSPSSQSGPGDREALPR